MKLPRFLRRRPSAEYVVDLSTAEARTAYAEALAAKEAQYQAARPLVDFSRPPTPPVVRRRGDGDPPPTFTLARKVGRPAPKAAQVVPDVWST
ncbi:hypothetical protein [Streptomyces sp. NPDC096033]|uniref:hypothetical protein n=1 Tax=Streptomyces sp. NPDC096033 TaxID=3366071 RepID=UPI003819C8E2